MGVPNPVKFRRKAGVSTVEYVSKIDRTKYLLVELERAALKAVGKFLRNKILDEVRKLRGLRRGKRPLRAFQFWVRRRDVDLWIGTKHNTWYGAMQEFGTSKQPKRKIITNTVMQNIDEVRRIEGQFLSAIEDENKALGLIDEDEAGGDDE